MEVFAIIERKHEKTCQHHMCRIVRKLAFCIRKNKDADQLHGNREADQRLYFPYLKSTIPLLPKSEAIFCGCTARFVSDLVGMFSRVTAHIRMDSLLFFYLLSLCADLFVSDLVQVFYKTKLIN